MNSQFRVKKNRLLFAEKIIFIVTSSAFQLFVINIIVNYSTQQTYLFNLPIFPADLTMSFFIVASIHFSLFFKIGFMNIAKIPLTFGTLTTLKLEFQNQCLLRNRNYGRISRFVSRSWLCMFFLRPIFIFIQTRLILI